MNMFTPNQTCRVKTPGFSGWKAAVAACSMVAVLGATSLSAQIITNGNFETPALSDYSLSGNISVEDIVNSYGGSIEGWGYFNGAGALAGSPSGLSNVQSAVGNQSLWLSSSSTGPQGGAGYYQGYAQTVNSVFEVGTNYSLSAYFKSDAVDVYSGNTYASVRMEFFTGENGSGTQVGSYEITVTPDDVTDVWQQLTVSGSVSMTASSVSVIISMVNPPEGYVDSSGILYIDNVSLIPEPATVGSLLPALVVLVGLRRRFKSTR